MNKIAISTALLVIAGLSANSASAADGRITLSGSIDSVTCSVRGGSGTDGNASDFTVTMRSVSESDLSEPYSIAGETPFSVTVGGSGQSGCTNGKVAKLSFQPVVAEYDAMFDRLKSTGTAKGVLVGITDSAGALIDITDNQNATSATISGNSATLNFKAHYFANPFIALTAGTVKATMLYSVQYN